MSASLIGLVALAGGVGGAAAGVASYAAGGLLSMMFGIATRGEKQLKQPSLAKQVMIGTAAGAALFGGTAYLVDGGVRDIAGSVRGAFEEKADPKTACGKIESGMQVTVTTDKKGKVSCTYTVPAQ